MEIISKSYLFLLIGILGFLLGSKKIIFTIFLSFIVGAVVCTFVLIFGIKQRKEYIPFAPFISIAFLITILWGNNIINWYLSII